MLFNLAKIRIVFISICNIHTFPLFALNGYRYICVIHNLNEQYIFKCWMQKKLTEKSVSKQILYGGQSFFWAFHRCGYKFPYPYMYTISLSLSWHSAGKIYLNFYLISMWGYSKHIVLLAKTSSQNSIFSYRKLQGDFFPYVANLSIHKHSNKSSYHQSWIISYQSAIFLAKLMTITYCMFRSSVLQGSMSV